MDGPIKLAIEREPRFFRLNELQSDSWRVGVAEDRDGVLVGSASVALRHVYVGGAVTPCAYASDLRIAQRWRGTTALARLHALMFTETLSLGAELGYTSIIAGNRTAEALAGSRATLPWYRPVADVRVCSVARPAPVADTSASVGPLREGDIEEVAQLLDEWNRRHLFAPEWRAESLVRAIGKTPGLTQDHFILARARGRVVGVLAAWDQRAIQRTRVLGYRRSVAIGRALYNAAAGFRGLERLPGAGELLRQVSITHVAVRDDDPAVFAALLRAAWRLHRADRPHSLTFGLWRAHPLLGALRGAIARSFLTRVYAIGRSPRSWSNETLVGPVFHEISHF